MHTQGPARGRDEWLTAGDAEKQHALARRDMQTRPAAGWGPPEEVTAQLTQPVWTSCLQGMHPHTSDHLPAQRASTWELTVF